MESAQVKICPEGHAISFSRSNFAKDFSDNEKDADFNPMYECGLYCYQCDRIYGLSKLKEPNK